jgi:flagellar P-ring protein precursor FlgI
VVGLDGTGDRQGTQTIQALSNFISRLGTTVPATLTNLNPKNVALVAVTAQLPAFIKKGGKIDVQVSSLGDASSLQGGILIQTPLKGADGHVYCVAQGAISVGGFSANGGGDTTVQKNHTLVGRIPNGGLIEREVETTFARDGLVRIALRKADFTTAQRMAVCINQRWAASAKAVDPLTVEFCLPSRRSADGPMVVVAELESLQFAPDMAARVVINERTGTIVAGAQVRLSPTVLSHGNLYITIKRAPVIVQPAALTNGNTVVAQDTTTETVEENGRAVVLEHGPTLSDLAAALNALKVKPRDIIAIFQALKEAGALNADLIIM